MIQTLVRGFLVSLGTVLFSQSALADYVLRKGDVLSYAILSADGIRGEAVIDIDGNVTLPLIGSFPADGRELGTFRQEIQSLYTRSTYPILAIGTEETLRRFTPEVVQIDIARYRPVYVLGAVAQSGEVAFSPGMTAIQAIVSAGGANGGAQATDNAQLQSDAFVLGARIQQARVLRDRLIEDLANLRDESSRSPGSDESGWVVARDAARDVQSEALMTTAQQIRDRLSVLKRRKKTAEESAALDLDELERIEVLAKQGLTQAVRVIGARQAVLLSSSRAFEIDSEIAAVDLELTRLLLDDDVTRMEETTTVLERISETEADLAILEAQYRSLVGMSVLALDDEYSGDLGLSLRIIRDRIDGPETIQATETTPLMPADVLKVSIRTRQSSGVPTASPVADQPHLETRRAK